MFHNISTKLSHTYTVRQSLTYLCFIVFISIYCSSTGPANMHLFTITIIRFSKIYKHLNYRKQIIRQKMLKFILHTHVLIQVFHHTPLTLTHTPLSVHSCKTGNIAWNTVDAINSLLHR